MTKRQMFDKLIRQTVFDSMTQTYGIQGEPTVKQTKLVDTLSDNMFLIFGKTLNLKQLLGLVGPEEPKL